MEEALLIADRQVGGGTLRVEAMFCRRVFRWSKAVARDRGGNLRTSFGVDKSGDSRRAKTAMQVGDKASEGKGLKSEQGSVGEGGGYRGGGNGEKP